MTTILVHTAEVKQFMNIDIKQFRMECDCGLVGSWQEEYWMAEDDCWYHIDYPEGE